MDVRQLRYFIAVAEEGHIGRAAQRFAMSEPPFTRHIQALEERIGVPLFLRDRRGMVLTPAGASLLADARRILGLLGQATERTQRSGRGETGRLDVGLYGSGVFGVMPQLLARFRLTHPDVDLALHYGQTPEQVQALRQGRVLIAFERLLPVEAPDLEVALVAREPLMLALAEQHPLARRQRIPVRLLEGQKIILGSSPVAAAQVVELCRGHGFEPQFAPAMGDLVMASLMASLDTGIAVVPRSMSHVGFPGITYRPLQSTPAAVMDMHCFYLRGERSPLLLAMLETVRGFRRLRTVR